MQSIRQTVVPLPAIDWQESIVARDKQTGPGSKQVDVTNNWLSSGLTDIASGCGPTGITDVTVLVAALITEMVPFAKLELFVK